MEETREDILKETLIAEELPEDTDTAEEGPSEESSIRESSIRESSIRDSSIRDSSIRDSSIRDSSIRASSIRESLMKESSMKESSGGGFFRRWLAGEDLTREDLPRKERPAGRFWTKNRVETARMVVRTLLAGFFAVLFLLPIILTVTNSLMTPQEISANYGMIFAKRNGVRVFISETVNLKFIPDIVSFGQYFKVLILSPEYLMKFWNSFIYVVPIVVFQLAVASLASYGFARYRGRVREVIFFAYIILMLMPYQVTLVPNYLVANWLHIMDTRWAIWLPGIFSPFAVYMLTKYMRRIPRSIYEAAEIDGAGEWQIFTQICLPNCRGGLASIAILLFIDYWNMVEQPLILLTNDQLHPLSVFLSRINADEISLAFAVAVIYMVLPMMVFLYGEEYLVEGIVYQGGIKE